MADNGPSEVETKFNRVDFESEEIDCDEHGARFVSIGQHHHAAVHENYCRLALGPKKIVIEEPLVYTWGTSNEFGQMGLADSEAERE